MRVLLSQKRNIKGLIMK